MISPSSYIENKDLFELNKNDFKQIAEKVIDLLLDFQKKSSSGLYSENKSSDYFADRFEEKLPENGKPAEEVFSFFETEILPLLFNALQPRITQLMANSIGLLSLVDLITSFLNVQPYPQINQYIETQVLKWLGEMVLFGQHAVGIMTSGGTNSNLYAIAVARVNKIDYDFRKTGVTNKSIIYSSTECHSSIVKSVELLGIGSENLRIIPTDEKFRINCKVLEEEIEADLSKGNTPFCLVANLGSVRTGSIDPIANLAIIAKKFNLWLHVDGAYGAFGGLYNRKKEAFRELEKADSITIDPHKWLNVPVESSCLLVREKQHLIDAFDHVPDYLGISPFDKQHAMRTNFELTKSDRALKVWFALQLFGTDNYTKIVTDHIIAVEKFSKKIERLDQFELLCKPDLSICCFRFIPTRISAQKKKYLFYINNLNVAIKTKLGLEGILITTVKIKGKIVLRVCVINYKFHEEYLAELIVSIINIGQELDEKMSG